MLRHIAQDTRQRANAEGAVPRNGDVVLAVFEGGEAQVAPGLAGHPIAELGECSREFVTG